MRLGDNKKGIISDKIFYSVRWEEMNINSSNIVIWDNQDIWLHGLISSNFLISNLYHNEIKR